MEAQINLSQCLLHWTHRVATRAIVIWGTLLGASAWGATFPAGTLQCAAPGGEKLFQARFTDKSTGTAREMTLAIHRFAPKKGASPQIIAQIRNEKSCEAFCQLRRFDPEDHLAAQSMDLDCRGAGLGHLVTPATVFWAKTKPRNDSDRAPALRFGTWLHGYVRVPLLVEVDRYTRPAPLPAPVLKVKTVHVASASLRR